MANRSFSEVQGLARKQILLAGKISLSSVGAVDAVDAAGAFTVAKTGTGLYTITLADTYQKALGVCPVVAGNPLVHAGVGAVDVAGAKTVVIQTISEAGILADTGAACEVYVTLVLSNSSVN